MSRVQGIGKGMMAAGMILMMIVATSFFSSISEKRRHPNQVIQSEIIAGQAQVSLKRNRQGHYLARGEINGITTDFLIDTGATDVVIPVRIAQDLKLKKGRSSIANTANGSVKVYRTRIDRLTMGDIVLENVAASINPGMQGQAVLLGMSALSQVEFVQSGNELRIRQYY
jgi:aspartyl protease family protein